MKGPYLTGSIYQTLQYEQRKESKLPQSPFSTHSCRHHPSWFQGTDEWFHRILFLGRMARFLEYLWNEVTSEVGGDISYEHWISYFNVTSHIIARACSINSLFWSHLEISICVGTFWEGPLTPFNITKKLSQNNLEDLESILNFRSILFAACCVGSQKKPTKTTTGVTQCHKKSSKWFRPRPQLHPRILEAMKVGHLMSSSQHTL